MTDYWNKRLSRLNRRGRLCKCGCGEKVVISLEWLKGFQGKRNVWLPKYKPGHMPFRECACGCGTKIEAFDLRGRPRQTLNQSHSAKMTPVRRSQDWEKRSREWNDNPPLCSCGCFMPITRTSEQLKTGYIPKYLPGHSQRRSNISSLTEREERDILGMLLGDMSISIPWKTPRLAFTHGIEQENYARFKMSALRRLSWSSTIAQTSGYSQKMGIRGSSSCLHALLPIYNLTRPNGPKEVTEDWLQKLDEGSLAFWFLDDGSFARTSSGLSQICLHTEGFSESEQHLMVSWFERERKVSPRVTPNSKGHFYLYFPRKEARSFVEQIQLPLKQIGSKKANKLLGILQESINET